MIHLFIYAFIIAIIAIVYKKILSHEPVLNWFFRWGLRFERRLFYKPIWGCEKCFAGQAAFWTYLFSWVYTYLNADAPFPRFLFFLIPKYNLENWSVFLGVFFVCLTMLLTFIGSKLYEKFENIN